MRFDSHYFGDGSEEFWRRVNKLPAKKHGELYALGVALQNLEHQVLVALAHAEGERKRPSRRAPRPGGPDA